MTDLTNVTTGQIPFTQYLMPDGRRQHVDFPTTNPEVFNKAQQILSKGLVFECEMLSDYINVSFTISDPVEETDVAHKLCRNGPDVPHTVEAMILEFDLNEYIAFRGDSQ